MCREDSKITCIENTVFLTLVHHVQAVLLYYLGQMQGGRKQNPNPCVSNCILYLS